MKYSQQVIVLVALLFAEKASAQVTILSTSYSPSNTGGATPTKFSVTVDLGTGISTTGHQITVLCGTGIFTNSVPPIQASPTVSLYDENNTALSAILSGTTTDASGRLLTITLGSGTVGAGLLLIEVTSELLSIPGAGTTLSFDVATSMDSGSGMTPSLYTLPTPSATVILSTVNYNSGTIPRQLDITFIFPMTVYSGNTIAIIASQSIFDSGVSTGLTAQGLTVSSYITTSPTELEITLGADKLLSTVATITMIGPITHPLYEGFLAPLPFVSGPVYISAVSSLAGNTVPMFTNVLGFGEISSYSISGNDPIAKLGSTVRVYELTPNILTPLLTAPDLLIHGSVFEGSGPWEQWFNRIVFFPVEQDRFIDIRMKPDLHELNYSRISPGVFATLEVTAGVGNISAPEHVFKVSGFKQQVPTHFMGYEIAFRKFQRHHSSSSTTIGKLPRECVDIVGMWLHVYVCSTAATEYYGNLHDLSMRYAHLDMLFIEVRNFNSLTGLLPELWGTQPMSDSTKACVKSDVSMPPNAI